MHGTVAASHYAYAGSALELDWSRCICGTRLELRMLTLTTGIEVCLRIETVELRRAAYSDPSSETVLPGHDRVQRRYDHLQISGNCRHVQTGRF